MTTAPSWLGFHLLLVGLLAVLASSLVLATMVVGTKGMRARRERRRAQHLEPYRGVLLEVAAGEAEPELARRLATVPARSWPTVQAHVLTLLGKVKGEPARALVQVLASHESLATARQEAGSRWAVQRGQAAVLLGRCGDRRDLGLLVQLLADRDALVRQAAAVALGQLGDAQAAAPLLSAVRSVRGIPGIPSGVAVDALLALDYGVEKAVVAALADPDPGVRSVAAEVVAGRNAIHARPAVRAALDVEQEPTVEARLCRALGAIGDDRDVPSLARAAEGGALVARQAAARALGAIDCPASAPVLARLLTDPEERLAGTAAHALATMHEPSAAEVLRSAAERGSAAATGELAVLGLRAAPRGGATVARVPEVARA